MSKFPWHSVKFPDNSLILRNFIYPWHFPDGYEPCAYMRQCIGSALVQIMACHLFGTKPLSKPMLGYCHLNLRNKLQWNFNQNTKLLINEIAFENIVCKMTTIFSRGRWVNEIWYLLLHCPEQKNISELKNIKICLKVIKVHLTLHYIIPMVTHT